MLKYVLMNETIKDNFIYNAFLLRACFLKLYYNSINSTIKNFFCSHQQSEIKDYFQIFAIKFHFFGLPCKVYLVQFEVFLQPIMEMCFLTLFYSCLLIKQTLSTLITKCSKKLNKYIFQLLFLTLTKKVDSSLQPSLEKIVQTSV